MKKYKRSSTIQAKYAAFVQAVIADPEALSVAAYCAKYGICVKSLYFYKNSNPQLATILWEPLRAKVLANLCVVRLGSRINNPEVVAKREATIKLTELFLSETNELRLKPLYDSQPRSVKNVVTYANVYYYLSHYRLQEYQDKVAIIAPDKKLGSASRARAGTGKVARAAYAYKKANTKLLQEAINPSNPKGYWLMGTFHSSENL